MLKADLIGPAFQCKSDTKLFVTSTIMTGFAF